MLQDIISNLHDIIRHTLTPNDIGAHLLLTHYDYIKSLRPYKDILNMEKWDQVINKIMETLSLSKDLNVMAWLIEALTYRYNVLGLYEGLKLLHQLLTMFPHCHPQINERKEATINWIRENFQFWLKEEEMFPGVQFRQIHQAILMGKIDNNNILGKSGGTSELDEYIRNKKTIISQIKAILEDANIPLLAPLGNQILSFFIKLDNFYNQALITNSKGIKNDHTQDLSKDDIFNEINTLVNKGLAMDSHDILLYIIHKILVMREKKNNTLVMKMIRDNSIEALLNS